MTNTLGNRTGNGYLDPGNKVTAGGWTVKFDPAALSVPSGAECYHIALTGPIGSRFQVWIDETFYSASSRGDLNDWDPNQPMTIDSGKTIFFYWNTALGAVPKVTIFLRQRTLSL